MQSEVRGPSPLSRNKEGIVSIPGYWALHLLSTGLGHWIRDSAAAAANRAADGAPRMSLRPLFAWLAGVASVGIVLEGLTSVLAGLVEPVSRRACNAAYVVWMLAFNTQVNLHRRLSMVTWSLSGAGRAHTSARSATGRSRCCTNAMFHLHLMREYVCLLPVSSVGHNIYLPGSSPRAVQHNQLCQRLRTLYDR